MYGKSGVSANFYAAYLPVSGEKISTVSQGKKRAFGPLITPQIPPP
jgi:hypothetical protein